MPFALFSKTKTPASCENHQQNQNGPETSESEQTLNPLDGDAPSDPDGFDIDVEKLGRQRPDILPSAIAEFAFCFSILWSMIMAVCISQYSLFLLYHGRNTHIASPSPGILHQRIAHHPPHPRHRSKHPRNLPHMDIQRPDPRSRRLSLPTRPRRRHVWRLHRPQRRHVLVLRLVPRRRLRPKLHLLHHLSRHARARCLCLPAHGHHASGESLPTGAEEEFRV